ncbi:MAG: hypothetical protein FWE90_10635 [Defluviitaleaceae bacterium]|nr:hypothetical protein [Defluviitaleaceae bacterium]
MAKTATDIGPIIRAIKQTNLNIDSIHDAVFQTDQNVQALLSGIDDLTEAFNAFAVNYALNTRMETASVRYDTIKKELASTFGAYGEVRRVAIEAVRLFGDGDIDGVRSVTAAIKGTASAYWLTHCLNALGAWLDGQKSAATASLDMALHINDGKTALFFTLVYLKTDRSDAAIQWFDYFLAKQESSRLCNDTIILLDEYRTGRFGADTENGVTERLEAWINPSDATLCWNERLTAMRPPLPADTYPFLRKHCPAWDQIKTAMETATLHRIVFDYLKTIFNQNDGADVIEAILHRLCTQYDDAEESLYEKLRFEQRVIDNGGDEQRAVISEKTETRTSIGELLQGESALSVILGHAALADAYRDIVQSTFIPDKIAVSVDSFTAETDGINELPLLDRYYRAVENEKQFTLSLLTPTPFRRFDLYIGVLLGLLGLVMLIIGHALVGLFVFIVCGATITSHYVNKRNTTHNRYRIEMKLDRQREKGIPILRAILKEIRQFKEDFETAQAACAATTDFISGITLCPPIKSTRGRKKKPSPTRDLSPP